MPLTRTARDLVSAALWPADVPASTSTYVVLDGARDDRVYAAVADTMLPKCCLYAGDLPRQLEVTAPYLVRIERDDRFARRVLDDGWGDSWGIFLLSEAGINTVRRHLRTLLRVRDEQNRRLVFRYYDPRVLRVFLPTCRPGELTELFGPISRFVMEGDDKGTLREFENESGTLVSRSKRLLAEAHVEPGLRRDTLPLRP